VTTPAQGSSIVQAARLESNGAMPHLLAGFLLPDVLSKEPLTPATIYADPAWAYAMRWGTMARCLSAM
jgi:hypothetical protein